jgi:osmoprotectant transport system permease protein
VAMASNAVILAGAIPAALLAIAADLLLGLLERRLAPPRASSVAGGSSAVSAAGQ